MAALAKVDVHHGATHCLLGLFDTVAGSLAEWSEFDAETERRGIEVRGLSREGRPTLGRRHGPGIYLNLRKNWRMSLRRRSGASWAAQWLPRSNSVQARCWRDRARRTCGSAGSRRRSSPGRWAQWSARSGARRACSRSRSGPPKPPCWSASRSRRWSGSHRGRAPPRRADRSRRAGRRASRPVRGRGLWLGPCTLRGPTFRR